MKMIGFLVLFVIVTTSSSFAQEVKFKKHENVIYGMISGMALLMDVYEPENGNGMGIIYIYGSGFGLPRDYQLVYNQVPLKDDYELDKNYSGKWTQGLVNKGYTVFVINHRFSPRFQYPDGLEDCRRAVRYIRYHADEYHIDSQNIGAMGHSSGGNFASMLGTYDQVYSNPDHNPVDSVSSKVQAVVALASLLDLSDLKELTGTDPEMNAYRVKAVSNYMGELPESQNGKYILSGKYAEASPLAHINKGDAAFLIYTSDNDPLAPPRQSSAMYEKLIGNGVEAKLRIDTGAGHEPIPDMDEVDLWFRKYLK